MPIFEYKCNDCSAQFELLVNSDSEIKCIGCGSKDLSKEISTFSSNDSCGHGGCSSCSGCH